MTPEPSYSPVLQETVRHALAYLDALPRSPVGATATLEQLRARLGRPLPAGPADATAEIEQLVRDVEGGLLGNAMASMSGVASRYLRLGSARASSSTFTRAALSGAGISITLSGRDEVVATTSPVTGFWPTPTALTPALTALIAIGWSSMIEVSAEWPSAATVFTSSPLAVSVASMAGLKVASRAGCMDWQV